MTSGMVNFFDNKNLSSDFLLLSGRQRRAFSERLNTYSKRELEVRLCRSRPRVPEERYRIIQVSKPSLLELTDCL